MRRALLSAMLLSVVVVATACRTQEPQGQPYALPSGDVTAGRQAFLDLRCWSCHEIEGGDMPKPVATPAVPVFLGGNARSAPDDLYLLQAIVNPSHELASGWGTENVQSGNISRMGDYSQVMTARQLFDLIAFLKSRYKAPA